MKLPLLFLLFVTLTKAQPLDLDELEDQIEPLESSTFTNEEDLESQTEVNWVQIQSLVQDNLDQVDEPLVVTDVAFTLCGIQGCEDTKETFDKPETVLEVAEQLGRTTFAELLRKHGLDAELSQSGPFTIFAPSNQAFEVLHYARIRVMTHTNSH